MPQKHLIIFVKAPRPGEVKTRLAKSLGGAGACLAYRQMVGVLLRNLASISDVELRYSPDDAESEIESWRRNNWTTQPQGSGDLGARLARAFSDAFARGVRHCVVIGSDCPEVTSPDIAEAWRELRNHDLVLGPATDGGYWLVGLNAEQSQLFEGIDWSTDQVLGQTLQRAKTMELRLQLLRILTDVDTAKEWRDFLAHHKDATSD